MPNPIQDPKVSVIVPVGDGVAGLDACLASLQASTFRDFEVIVVHAGLSGAAVDIAQRMGARLVQLDGPMRPVDARSRGFAASQGEYVVFLNADVCMHSETLARLVETLENEPDAGAVFASCDARPDPPDLVSQYNNLLEHYVQQSAYTGATAFWTGCGAVRRAVLECRGALNARAKHCDLENEELGRRLRQTGYRILFNSDARIRQRTPWTLESMLKYYLLDRGLPEARLMLEHRGRADDYNFQPSQRWCLVLAFTLLVLALLGIWHGPARLIPPLLGLALVVALDHWRATLRLPKFVRFSVIGAVVLTAVTVSLSFQLWSLFAVVLLVGIFYLNRDLFSFLSLERGSTFAVRAFPLHILQYWCRAIAFVMVAARHYPRELFARLKTASRKRRRRLGHQRRLRQAAAAELSGGPFGK